MQRSGWKAVWEPLCLSSSITLPPHWQVEDLCFVVPSLCVSVPGLTCGSSRNRDCRASVKIQWASPKSIDNRFCHMGSRTWVLCCCCCFFFSKCDLGQGPLSPQKQHKNMLLVYSLPLWLPKSWLNWNIMFLIRQLSAVVANSSFPKAFAWLLKCFIAINKNTIWEGCADMWIAVMTSSTSLSNGSGSLVSESLSAHYLEGMRMLLSPQQVHRTHTQLYFFPTGLPVPGELQKLWNKCFWGVLCKGYKRLLKPGGLGWSRERMNQVW